MTATYALGALSVAALVVTTGYLWLLLRDFPFARRAVNLLLPLSQLACVLFALGMAQRYELGEPSALLISLIGIVCAVCDPLLYRSVLRAERADLERDRTRLLEDQVKAQAHHLARARQAEGAAAGVRQRLDGELRLLEEALAAGDEAAMRSHLAGAADAVRAPGERVCQHPAADALLAAKRQHCDELGIRTEIDAAIPADLDTPAVELCAVLANALDNAIAACEQLPVEDRWLSLAARRAHGHFSVTVENACTPAPRDRRHRHRRQANLPEHGWGLSIIEGVARRHDGELICRRAGTRYHMDVIWRA